MVSSTVDELIGERKAIGDLFDKMEIVNLIGAKPFADTSVAYSSSQNTTSMARECDLYILILGNSYGTELKNGKSATEVEFDAAYHDDPTKVLVFLKESNLPVEDKQQEFIKKVCDYYSGYWRTTFKYTHELQTIVKQSFISWLKDRASFCSNYSYFDHFIRIALQKRPVPEAKVYYSVKEDYIDIEYRCFGKVISIQFNKESIYKDFWGCLYQLDNDLTAQLDM